MKKYFNKKINVGSNGKVKHNRLIRGFNINKYPKYLNLSINLNQSCAGMVEWLTHPFDTRNPLGYVGSIPAPSATNFNLNNLKIIK